MGGQRCWNSWPLSLGTSFKYLDPCVHGGRHGTKPAMFTARRRQETQRGCSPSSRTGAVFFPVRPGNAGRIHTQRMCALGRQTSVICVILSLLPSPPFSPLPLPLPTPSPSPTPILFSLPPPSHSLLLLTPFLFPLPLPLSSSSPPPPSSPAHLSFGASPPPGPWCHLGASTELPGRVVHCGPAPLCWGGSGVCQNQAAHAAPGHTLKRLCDGAVIVGGSPGCGWQCFPGVDTAFRGGVGPGWKV